MLPVGRLSLALCPLLLIPMAVRPVPAQSAFVDATDVIPVRSIAFGDTSFADLEPLAEKIGTARIVVLGEATHSEGTTSRAKARLVRFLHERMGFDVLAWEAGLLDAWWLNAALRGDAPVGWAATHLMRGGWDESVFSRPVFAYARETWKTNRPLLMAGFDTGTPPRGADHAVAHLALAGRSAPLLRLPAGTFESVERLAHRAYSYLGRDTPVLTQTDRAAAREALEEMLAQLEQPTQELRKRFADRELLVLRLAIRGLLVDDELREQITRRVPEARQNYNRMRDSLMAVQLASVADSLYPGRKIIVWAATAHMIRNSATITSLEPGARYGTYRLAGDFLGPKYGDALYTIGFVAHAGEYGDVFAEDDERGESATGELPALRRDSFEAAAHRLSLPYLFVDMRSLPAGHPLRDSFVSHALGYIPNRATWSQVLDAFFFIDRAGPDVHHPRATAAP